MHKLVDYICDELEELERKAEKDGKLSMAEVQYMDTLAHAKKNLLKGEEMMGEGYSGTAMPMYDNRSMARGRQNARRDARGRYSSDNRGRYSDMSYADEMDNMIDSIHNIMNDLPEDARRDAQKFVKKLEGMM